MLTDYMQQKAIWQKIQCRVDAGRAKKIMAENRVGMLGHYYCGMLANRESVLAPFYRSAIQTVDISSAFQRENLLIAGQTKNIITCLKVFRDVQCLSVMFTSLFGGKFMHTGMCINLSRF